jgi:hypothetical protein
VLTRPLGEDEPITVVVDDTLFKRWGRKVHHAFWTHDGAAQGGQKIVRGNHPTYSSPPSTSSPRSQAA